MQGMRRRLTRFAGSWLVLQLTLVSAAPVALCGGVSSNAASVQCTCSHGDGAECPMHHAASSDDSRSCSCRGTADDGIAVVAALIGETGVLGRPTRVTGPSVGAPAPQEAPACPLDLSLVPDPPPPRA